VKFTNYISPKEEYINRKTVRKRVNLNCPFKGEKSIVIKIFNEF
jgi:hypothetical protein